VDKRFEFTAPPLRHSLAVVLAFAATADRPAAVLTGPTAIAGAPPDVIRLPRATETPDMVQLHRWPSADRDGGSGVERRPAALAPADPV
jgi:hypothetical protein